MTKIDLKKIKKLRDETKAGVMDCRQALETAKGDMAKAKKKLAQKGKVRAEKKAGRTTNAGFLASYSHGEGQIVAVVELLCETDFVAKNDEFKRLGYELAMQVAAMNPKNVKALLTQPWIREEKKTIKNLIEEMIGKTGENIKLSRFVRLELGEKKGNI